jgi:hypothetical protein
VTLRKSKRRLYTLLAAVLVAALVTTGALIAARPSTVTLPEGTLINVRFDHTLSSAQNRPGDQFTATVAQDVVIDNQVAVPAGSIAYGRVVDARESGRLAGVARLRLELVGVELNGETYNVETTPTSRRGGDHKKRNWWLIGGGGGGGAAIGAIAGGGKGALIGGPIGAGAGLAYAAITGKKDITLPAETLLSFRLTQPATVEIDD